VPIGSWKGRSPCWLIASVDKTVHLFPGADRPGGRNSSIFTLSIKTTSMKKFILLLAAILAVGTALAQDKPVADLGDDLLPKNKRGNAILPKAGDIGLGFNAIPILDLVFDSFKSGGANPGNMVQYTSGGNNQITGKYFIDPHTAVRARFGINTLGGTITNKVQDAQAKAKASTGTPDDVAAASLITVEDKLAFKKNNVMFSVGVEKRRGYRRLQGFYGAELGIGTSGSTEKTTYGNPFSDQHEVIYTNDFNALTTTSVQPTDPGRTERNTEVHHRGGFRIGVRGFIGIEYFIFAKISVAAEYGWGYSIASRRAATIEREVYNNGQNGPSVFTEKVQTDSKEVQRGFSVDNNNGSAFSLNNTLNGNTALSGGAGSLTLLFHF
jgi:hypothetical protein